MFDPPCGVFLWAFYESYAFVWGAGVYLLHAGKGALRRVSLIDKFSSILRYVCVCGSKCLFSATIA